MALSARRLPLDASPELLFPQKQNNSPRGCPGLSSFEVVPVEVAEAHIGEISSFLLFNSTLETEGAVEIYPEISGFVRDVLRGKEHLAVASNLQARGDLDTLLELLGRLYVSGHELELGQEHGVEAHPREALLRGRQQGLLRAL